MGYDMLLPNVLYCYFSVLALAFAYSLGIFGQAVAGANAQCVGKIGLD
jgi:ABC-type molybdate transport system permease subunit